MKTKEEILDEVKDKHNIGTAWQITKPIILEAMEEYASQFKTEPEQTKPETFNPEDFELVDILASEINYCTGCCFLTKDGDCIVHYNSFNDQFNCGALQIYKRKESK